MNIKAKSIKIGNNNVGLIMIQDKERLEVSDKITLLIRGNRKILDAFDKYKQYIQKECMIEKLILMGNS